MPETVTQWAFRGGKALAILAAAWVMGKIIDAIIVRHLPGVRGGRPASGANTAANPPRVQAALRTTVRTAIAVSAFILALHSLGFNVSALLAGLGLGGAALALASKDTLANFFGSITVFFDRPFRLNDRIKVAGYDGVIVEMNLRTSRLLTAEGRLVTIPNSFFPANPIENLSVEPFSRVFQTVAIRADGGPERAEQAIAILAGLADGAEAGLTAVSGAVCTLSFRYPIPRGSGDLAFTCDVNLRLLRRFAEAGINLA